MAFLIEQFKRMAISHSVVYKAFIHVTQKSQTLWGSA